MNTTNSINNPTKLKGFTLLGFICLLIPLTIYGLWMSAFGLGTNQSERVTIFNEYFPDFLHGRWGTTLLSITFCILAIVFSSISLKLSGNFWKFLNITILLFSTLLLLLNLFSMM